MRIIHTSDLHIGKNLYDFSLLEEQEAVLSRILDLITKQHIDVLLIAGDIYDRPVPSAQAVRLYDEFLAEAVVSKGVAVMAVAGNHDSASRLEFGSSLYASSGYHISGQPRETAAHVTLEDEHGPVTFWLLPYLQPADVRALFPEERAQTFDDAWRVLLERSLCGFDPQHRNIAVAHGFFSAIGGREDLPLLTSDSEVNIGGMDIADSGIFARFDYAALGHLHAPQHAGAETIRYSGSPLKYSLSEERQRKAVTLIELGAKGDIAVSELALPALRDVRTVAGALDELLDPSFHRNQNFDDYVFATLTEEGALYPMEKLRKLFPRLLGLRIAAQVGDAAPEIKLGGSVPRLSPEELFHRFYREVKGIDMPDDAVAFLRETIQSAEEVREQ